jgi:hypothetical protein
MDEQQLMSMMQQGQPQPGEEIPMEPGEEEQLPMEEDSTDDGNAVPDEFMDDEENSMMSPEEEEIEYMGEYEDMEQEDLPQETDLEPQAILSELVLQYMDFAMQIKDDQGLNMATKTQSLVQMAQALNYLVPMIKDGEEQQMKHMEFQLKEEEQQANLQMKSQEHEMNLQFKREELQLKMQELQMKMEAQKQQQQIKNQQAQLQAANQQQKHNQQLVQNEEKHKIQKEQAKQASQSKPVNKDSK